MSSSAQDAEIAYSKATKSELAKDWDHAFQFYIKAAEGYLHLSRITIDEGLRARYKSNAGKALQRAEKIKDVRHDLTDTLWTEEEQFHILKQSSIINGLRFPLWDDHSTSSSQTEDQPRLSREQLNSCPIWRRPNEVTRNVAMTSSSLLPQEIIQQIVTDCSVCASLSVSLEHHRRFGSKMSLSCLYPQDSDGVPRFCEEGKYNLRFFVNGGYRRVSIDDKLPFHPDETLLCMSTGSKNHLWPPLVEKAYMKLMGGYAFPGSNSCIDLHTLAGWIPEHIEVKSPTFEREKTWSRIVRGFAEGRCVVTVGTSDRRDVSWRWGGFQLLPSHSYAVIDVIEWEEKRTFTVLDSWVQPTSHCNTVSRVLQIPWIDICNIFHGIYVSWDPARFQHQLVFHGLWKPKNSKDDSQTSNRHLRLKVNHSEATVGEHEIWVLLTRHIVDSHREAEYMSLRMESEETSVRRSGIDKLSSKGVYTNSSHVLAKHQISPSDGALSILASYDGIFEHIGFTITAYSSIAISWDESITEAPFTTKMDGTLVVKNSGGNCTYPTFMMNPQYHLHIHPENRSRRGGNLKARVELVLQGPRDVPLNILVVWSQGKRIFEIIEKDIAANSGPYSYGISRILQHLPAGDYTVIVSAFEPQHFGKFSIKVESSHRFDLKVLQHEGAGMYSKTIRGQWNTNTAMGSPSFQCYSQNPIYELDVKSLTQVKIRLQMLKESPSISINLTLFPSLRNGTLGRQLATSGPYSDAISGVAIPQTTLSPGKYVLIPSTYEPGLRGSFQLIFYSSGSEINVVLKDNQGTRN